MTNADAKCYTYISLFSLLFCLFEQIYGFCFFFFVIFWSGNVEICNGERWCYQIYTFRLFSSYVALVMWKKVLFDLCALVCGSNITVVLLVNICSLCDTILFRIFETKILEFPNDTEIERWWWWWFFFYYESEINMLHVQNYTYHSSVPIHWIHKQLKRVPGSLLYTSAYSSIIL